MKKFMLSIIILSMVLSSTACFSPDEPDETVASLDTAEYRAQWSEDYEYDVPIEIDSYANFEIFLSDHPQQDLEIEELTLKFNEEFFVNNLIYAYVKSEPSGSNELEADKAVLENGTLILKMDRYVPEIGTTDMAARVCIFALSRETMTQVSTVIGLITETERE
ncbi:hypothetical protein [Alkalibacter saccharofermentans]|uniref:Lipoprotein n=1 Tax=Alkalibacter saccharofermentans DSM 14828 TaxID=1120975 RepID=A0A1M4YUV3_9FIRM|nr:hypothetical protein [Alkalibacter saccharofermentans]SHF09498.1 hypothetical protein SAMN02746064_01864 [Alkalibacter saccharofermentans DSM 14828]